MGFDRLRSGMDEFGLRGAPRELGRQFAATVERSGRTIADVSPEPLDPSAPKRRFARDCVPHLAEHAPWLLDEVDAIAERAGVDPGAVRLVPLALDADPGCSLVGIAGERAVDGPLFGRNHDYHPSFRRYSKLFLTRPSDGHASVGCASTFVGRLDGFNEAGLAIGFAGVPTERYVPGVAWPLAVRAVLDTCASVAEGVDFLEGLSHARNVNFLLVDADGDLAVVEAGPDAVDVVRPDRPWAIATNQFDSERMRAHQSSDRRPRDCSRYQQLQEVLGDGEGRIGREELRVLMGDPDRGVARRLDPAGDDPRSTIWSWVVAPSERAGSLARGSLVEHPYEPVSVPGGEGVDAGERDGSGPDGAPP